MTDSALSTGSDGASASDRSFSAALALCCAAALAPLWLVGYPPMVDLPQHAAQVATWHRWGAGDFDYSQYFWINRATPYVVANFLAYLLSFAVPVLTAFKIVISCAVVGVPLATRALLRETGGNRWWSLAAVPVGYSYAFFMGFVAFALAVPVALFVLLVAWRYAGRPTVRLAWLLFALLQLLFFTHVLLFGWAGLTAALLTAARSPEWRSALRRWLPLLGAAVLPFSWMLLTFQIDATTQSGAHGLFRWARLHELVALVVGFPPGAWPLVFGGLLLLVPFLTGGRPSADPARWIPVGLSLGLFLFLPERLFGTDFVQPRFAVLVLPTLLFALERRRRHEVRWRGRALIAALSLAWLAHLGTLFWAYQAETGSLHKLLDGAPASARVLYLPLGRDSEHIPYPVFLHAGVWYQVERGGLVDFSFAQYFPNRYRYHPEKVPDLPSYVEWRPRLFDWYRHDGALYDLILVHAEPGQDAQGFIRGLRAPLVPVAAASGGWTLWARADPR